MIIKSVLSAVNFLEQAYSLAYCHSSGGFKMGMPVTSRHLSVA